MIVRKALARAGLDGDLYRIGLNTDCGIRGRFLPMRLKLAVPLAQALIKAPQIAVLDVGAFLATSTEPDKVVARLREHCAGMTLFLLVGDASLVAGVPLRDRLQRPVRGVRKRGRRGCRPCALLLATAQRRRADGGETMTLEADISSLGRLPLFRSLPPPRLKLVALMGEKLHFDAGTQIIEEGEKPEGVYVVLQGRGRISHESADGHGPRLQLNSGSIIGDVRCCAGRAMSARSPPRAR